ncbi:MAG: primosomal replication protein N [Gammaproteobacteria bacterium]|nr:primosomal replication protein N [Gammaproteobacteria bacterium]
MNRVVLEGEVCRAPQTRLSPARIPLTRFTLEHRSQQTAGGIQREARLRMVVVAAGSGVSRDAAALQPGDRVQVEGFLTRGSYQVEERELALQANGIRRL